MDFEFALAAQIEDVKGPVLKNGIKGIHEAFADYMLINPGCTLREMAQVFGYTISWICTVINSDMFKAYFAERRQGVSVSIAQDLPSKLKAAAHLATERIMEVLETTNDTEVIVDAFDKVMHRYGFAPNAKGGAHTAEGSTNVQNNFFINSGELEAARKSLMVAHQLAQPTEKLVHADEVSTT